MPPSVDWPLTAVGAKLHRPIVGTVGDDRHRPGELPPVIGQVRQQFDHGSPTDAGASHGLDSGLALGQPGHVVVNEPPQLLWPRISSARGS